jgi:protein TonB
MFAESVAKGPETSRARQWTVALSVIVHVGAAAAFVVFSFWKIDRLAYKDRLPPVRAGVELPYGNPPQAKAATPKVPKVKRDPAALAQPSDKKPDPGQADPGGGQTAPTGPSDPSAPTCEGCSLDGNPEVPPGITGDPFGGGRPEIPEATPEKPQAVTLETMAARRVSGEEQIQLDASVLAQLPTGTVQVNVLVCVDTDGSASATVRRSSGYAAVDDTVARGVRGWRFKPYEVGGVAQRACFMQPFSYQISR